MSTHNSSPPPPPPPRHKEWKLGCKVYIGNLAEGASKADIEDSFSKYGPLRNVWVARNPPGFAFVEFEDGRDAEDACRHLDGTSIAGGRIKAEMSHGRSRRDRGGGRSGGRSPSYHGSLPPYPVGPYGAPPPSMSRYGSGPPRGYHHPSAEYPPYGHHYGPPVRVGGGYHNHHQYHGHMDRPRERHMPRPRIPMAMKDSFRRQHHHSRSRSNSLGKSPPPPPPPSNNTSQPPQAFPPRAARPRTPPSRSLTPERL